MQKSGSDFPDCKSTVRAFILSRRRMLMPEQQTIERAREDAREGKSPSTQAGEFVREEMHHIREGKHGARSTKQAIAIGLSKARRAGVKLSPPRSGQTSSRTRKQAARDMAKGQRQPNRKPIQNGPGPRRERSNGRAGAPHHAPLCRVRRGRPHRPASRRAEPDQAAAARWPWLNETAPVREQGCPGSTGRVPSSRTLLQCEPSHLFLLRRRAPKESAANLDVIHLQNYFSRPSFEWWS